MQSKINEAKFNIYSSESSVATTVERMDGNLYISVLFKTADVESANLLFGATCASESLILLERIVSQVRQTQKTNN